MSHRLFAAICVAALLLPACNPSGAPATGRVGLTVKWPSKGAQFRILAIPEATARIEVSLRGEGIPESVPLKGAISRTGEEDSLEFGDVPTGPKWVEAIAFDGAGVRLATGGVAIAVQPNSLTPATITLQPLAATTPSPMPSASEQPTPTPSGSEPAGTPSPLLPNNVIVSFAGDGQAGAIDARDGLSARFDNPRSLAYDANRQLLFVADANQRLIRQVDLVSGAVSTVAGRSANDGQRPAGVPPALAGAAPGVPSGLALDSDGALYFCDRDNHMVRKITTEGLIVNVAGTGRSGYIDGQSEKSLFAFPADLSIDNFRNIYVADTFNNRIRRITGSTVTTVLGADAVSPVPGVDVSAINPALDRPTSVLVEPGGRSFYFAEAGARRVSRFDLGTGRVTLVAGSGQLATNGEDGPAQAADVPLPLALAFDLNGDLLIADGWFYSGGGGDLQGGTSRILRVTADGRLVRLAGQQQKAYGFGGDGADARFADLNNPSGLAVDSAGRIFVADTFNNRIRQVRPAAVPTPAPATPMPSASVEPKAGTPAPAASGVGIPALVGSTVPTPP